MTRTERAGWPLAVGRLPREVRDVTVAAAMGAAVTLGALLPEEAGQPNVAPAAYALGVGFGLAHLLRRRRPVTALLVATALLNVYLAFLPAFGATWPLVVLLYTCAAAGRWLAGAVIGSVPLLLGIPFRVLQESEELSNVVYFSLREVAIAALALLLGDAMRSRREIAAQREREAERRVVAERVRIAQELHDITAHTLAVVGIQLGVADDARDVEEMRAAVGTARAVNRDAIAELRAALLVLRDAGHDEPQPPAPQPADIAELLETTRAAGLAVSYAQAGEPAPLPAPIGLAVYRIVQESLTNALRHAGASTVTVSLGYTADGVAVEVADDGGGPGPDSGPGHGLIGMRERVLGLRGTFDAGARDSGGFAVRAWIPREVR